jgi:hypothetical protein
MHVHKTVSTLLSLFSYRAATYKRLTAALRKERERSDWLKFRPADAHEWE